MEKIKVIFLDIDGVLNHELFYRERHKNKDNEGIEYPYSEIDLEKVELLRYLIELTNAKVVLSSSWRKSEKSVNCLNDIFNTFGFEILDTTPYLYFKIGDYIDKRPKSSVPRGSEIKYWIDYNGKYEVDNYVIFDDDSDMLLSQQENYFRIDPYCGLTKNVIYRAQRFLNNNRS